MDINKIMKIALIVFSTLVVLVLGYLGYLKYIELNNRISIEKANVEAKVNENNTLTALVSELQSTVDGYKKKDLEAETKKEKTGKVKFSFGFPSEFTPAFRVCFSNIDDKSKQYCFWKKNSEDKKSYANDLSGISSDTVTLPVAKYNMDFTVYTFSSLDGTSDIEVVSESFFLNECVYYSDGSGMNMTVRNKSCKSVEDKLKTYPSGIYLPYYIVNNDGGKSVTIDVKEDKTLTLKTISLSPYFDLN